MGTVGRHHFMAFSTVFFVLLSAEARNANATCNNTDLCCVRFRLSDGKTELDCTGVENFPKIDDPVHILWVYRELSREIWFLRFFFFFRFRAWRTRWFYTEMWLFLFFFRFREPVTGCPRRKLHRFPQSYTVEKPRRISRGRYFTIICNMYCVLTCLLVF